MERKLSFRQSFKEGLEYVIATISPSKDYQERINERLRENSNTPINDFGDVCGVAVGVTSILVPYLFYLERVFRQIN